MRPGRCGCWKNASSSWESSNNESETVEAWLAAKDTRTSSSMSLTRTCSFFYIDKILHPQSQKITLREQYCTANYNADSQCGTFETGENADHSYNTWTITPTRYISWSWVYLWETEETIFRKISDVQIHGTEKYPLVEALTSPRDLSLGLSLMTPPPDPEPLSNDFQWSIYQNSTLIDLYPSVKFHWNYLPLH
ncbi:MAG: hypothetical protein Q4E67_02255 [Planctomycetia bacterium]|nr:hypothetical protein [Planctomycetia bacterium]